MYMNLELVEYIKKIINEHYSLNDKGHDIHHAEYVINRSLKFAQNIENIDLNMVYVIAAYHDIAHHIDAKKHEELSAKLLKEDLKLKEFFSEDKIKIMSEAVEDHRSSLEGEPRTIYGKIVSSADRNTSVEVTLKRCYSYNKKHSPELDEKDLIEKCRLFILEKFGVNGYARNKMFFKDEDYDIYLDEITEIALDDKKFAQKIKEVNGL